MHKLAWLVGGYLVAALHGAAFEDVPFLQETHEAFPLTTNGPGNDVRAVAVTADGTAWAATMGGLYALPPEGRVWVAQAPEIGPNPVFAVAASGGEVWAGAWNGLYRGGTNGLSRVGNLTQPVAAIGLSEGLGAPTTVLIGGPDGFWVVRGGGVSSPPLACSRYLHGILPGSTSDEWWLATSMGLFHVPAAGEGGYAAVDKPPASRDVRGVAFDTQGDLWVGGAGGVTVYHRGRPKRFFGTADGLPHAHVQCVARGPDGQMWVGTKGGLARYDGQRWSVRMTRRWLLDDDVRAIAFDASGRAWMATAGGVSRLATQRMTLAEKEWRFQAVCAARHIRPPGIVEKCRLRVPGDLATGEPDDDDNDGGYTAFYVAMQSFCYAVTKDPGARAAARRAFDALWLLREITGTNGFLARTVVPVDWTRMKDANTPLSEPAQAAERVENPRAKYVPERWRLSADGRWRWKGDTSSDEVTAHFFGYYFYYELAADEAERARVRQQVCAIADHLIANGYVLRDIDGRATLWGVWAPERLRHDPNWAMEAGINAVEILSYLKLAAHVSGDARYDREAWRLLDEHGYRELVPRAKNLDPGWRTHIDDELLAFAWPALLALERDPKLRRLYRDAFERWHQAVQPDQQPFFEMLYAAYGDRHNDLSTAVFFLRDTPLDLVRWTFDQSRREDLRLVRVPELEYLQTDRLLPPSERAVLRTDENPRKALLGDDGLSESDGVFWLLPYWMGRHFGFLNAPRPPNG